MILTTSMLREQYRDYHNPMDKIKRQSDKGSIIRLNRGIYETDPNTEPHLLAASILSPSYLSFEYALSRYGLIPERVYEITSASLHKRKNKVFENQFGRYSYSDIPPSAFSEGLLYVEEQGYGMRIASKEKAICDSLYKWRTVHGIDELKELLFVDKRIYEEEFAACDFALLLRLAPLYRRKNLDLLARLIRKEYCHE